MSEAEKVRESRRAIGSARKKRERTASTEAESEGEREAETQTESERPSQTYTIERLKQERRNRSGSRIDRLDKEVFSNN